VRSRAKSRSSPAAQERLEAPALSHAYCPLCGKPNIGQLARQVRGLEDALCSERCIAGWQALAILRDLESKNQAVATRRRLELDEGRLHAALLSELLSERWRAGDWGLEPRDVLARLSEPGPLV
jgi:hypothetical protein